jgi:hypothetical protein
MKVVVSEEATQYVKGRGGVLYVRSSHHRCCGGGLTMLDATTEQPSEASDFFCVGSAGIEVRFLGGARRPHELVIELRGRARRRRPVALWDGCAFRP